MSPEDLLQRMFLCAAAAIGGCAGGQAGDSPRAMPPAMVEVSPGLRVDRRARAVEFIGAVSVDVRAQGAVQLECVVCTPDTREYESLVVTPVRPSRIHAALLRLGLRPGQPGRFDFVDGKLIAIDPTGPRLRVSFHWLDDEGTPRSTDPSAWITADPAAAGPPMRPAAGFVFAGSGFARSAAGAGYFADSDGTLIGLAAFGSETIAYADAFSPESAYSDQVWFADTNALPPMGRSVTVRLEPEDQPR